MHIVLNGRRLTVERTAGVSRKLQKQFIGAFIRKPPWSTKVFILTVCEIEHHDVVSSAIFADEFPDKHPREWTK